MELRFFYNKFSIAGMLLLAIYCLSCRQKNTHRNIERSFYYWKAVFNPTAFEKKELDSLAVKTIYLKFFDVDWDNEKLQPGPKATVNIIDSSFISFEKINIIPTVFITNECIQKLQDGEVNSLANKISSLVKSICKISLPIKAVEEVQIDCDWTIATKEKYFRLLESIKKSGIPTLSATIRLHQVKFMAQTGVPPVDRGLLMCYNMGNLKSSSIKNSILDADELKKYTSKLSAYPLQLDIGLPLFDWYVLFRNNQFQGLVKSMDILNPAISKINENQFAFIKDTIISDVHFKKGDVLRQEKSEYKEIMKTAEYVSDKLKNTTLRVALFHLDSITLKKYSLHELESIYNSLL
jgi:hypothetical protein